VREQHKAEARPRAAAAKLASGRRQVVLSSLKIRPSDFSAAIIFLQLGNPLNEDAAAPI
jgi:hypothetical protein